MTPDPQFELIAAKLEALKAHHERELNRMIFSDGANLPHAALPPIPWWMPIYGRVRGYLLNLWDALSGRIPPESEGW